MVDAQQSDISRFDASAIDSQMLFSIRMRFGHRCRMEIVSSCNFTVPLKAPRPVESCSMVKAVLLCIVAIQRPLIGAHSPVAPLRTTDHLPLDDMVVPPEQ